MSIANNSELHRFYVSYKGLWYRYHPYLEQWWISDKEYAYHGWLFTFDANKKRIDECFEIVFKFTNRR